MSGAEVLDLGREAIWVTVLVAAGPMIVGLVVGWKKERQTVYHWFCS